MDVVALVTSFGARGCAGSDRVSSRGIEFNSQNVKNGNIFLSSQTKTKLNQGLLELENWRSRLSPGSWLHPEDGLGRVIRRVWIIAFGAPGPSVKYQNVVVRTTLWWNRKCSSLVCGPDKSSIRTLSSSGTSRFYNQTQYTIFTHVHIVRISYWLPSQSSLWLSSVSQTQRWLLSTMICYTGLLHPTSTLFPPIPRWSGRVLLGWYDVWTQN